MSFHRRSLLLPVKQLVQRALCHPAIGRSIATAHRNRIRHHGCLIDTQDPTLSDRLKASLYWGFFEKSETLLVERFLPPDHDVIELGAGIGVVSAHIARRLRGARRLLCVEANPRALSRIAINVSLNAAIVPEVIHAAIDYGGAAAVAVELAARHLDTRLGWEPGGEHAGDSNRESIRVPTATLGQLWSSLGRPYFSLVADIEGAEAGILEHESECLANCRAMVLELHSSRDSHGSIVSPDDLAQWACERHGFRQLARRGNVVALVRP